MLKDSKTILACSGARDKWIFCFECVFGLYSFGFGQLWRYNTRKFWKMAKYRVWEKIPSIFDTIFDTSVFQLFFLRFGKILQVQNLYQKLN
jgi:hypothetical protein